MKVLKDLNNPMNEDEFDEITKNEFKNIIPKEIILL